MSISAHITPNKDANYFLNRLISDLVGSTSNCASDIAEVAVDATYDSLGSVYPLIGSKGNSKELIGTSVSIGGGYLLTARHSLSGYLKPYSSYGVSTSPGLGIAIGEGSAIHQSEILSLQIVTIDFAAGLDLIVLRVKDIDDSQKLSFARLPIFEPGNVSQKLISLINHYGIGALFVGFGAMTRTGMSQKLQKNDISTFICNKDLAEQTMFQLYNAPCDRGNIDKNGENEFEDVSRVFLSMGSSLRHPHWNDSGGGLFVFYEGKVYLVGLHFKAIKFGTKNPVTYPLFINLLSAGPGISNAIKQNRDLSLEKSNAN